MNWNLSTKNSKLGGLSNYLDRMVPIEMNCLYQETFIVERIVPSGDRLFDVRLTNSRPSTFYQDLVSVERSLSMILVRFALRENTGHGGHSWTKWWILNKFGHFYWFWNLVRGYFLFKWPYAAHLLLLKILEQRIPRTILSFRTRGHVWDILRTFLCILNNCRT